MSRTIFAAALILPTLVAAVAISYIIGQSSVSPSDSEVAYRLTTAVERETNRTVMILATRSYSSSTCLRPEAVKLLTAWADKCSVPDCSIDSQDKDGNKIPYAPFSTPKRVDAQKPAVAPAAPAHAPKKP